MKKKLKKLYKILLIAIVVFIVFLITTAIFTQTGIFKNWLKKQIISNSGKALIGSLVIGEIKGNLITNFAITDISFVKGPDTLLILPLFEIQFRPVDLIHKKITFRAVRIDSPRLKIKQLADSTWNYDKLLKKNNNKPNQDSDSDFNWQLTLDNLALNNGSLAFCPVNDGFRTLYFKNINALCSLNYEKNNLTGLLENLSFQLNEPQINLKQFYVNLAIVDTVLNISQFNLQSETSLLAGNVSIDLKKPGINKLQLDCIPLDLSEIKKFVPTLPVYGLLETHLNAQTKNDSLFFDASLNKKDETIALRGSISDPTALPSFYIDMDFNKLNLVSWLESAGVTSNLTGQVKLEGSGKDLENMNAELNTRIIHSRVNELHIRDLTAFAQIFEQKIRTKFQTVTNAGKVDFNGHSDMDNELNTNAACRFYNINVEKLFPNFTSDISGEFNISGQLNPKDPDISVFANLSGSSINDIPVDTLFTNLNYTGQQLKIDTLYSKAKHGQFTLNGTAGADSTFSLFFNYDVGDLSDFLDSSTGETNGKITGIANGKIDSMQFKTQYQFEKTSFQNNYADKINGFVHFNYSKSDMSGTGVVNLYNNTISGISIDSVMVDVEYADNCIGNSVRFAVNDTIYGKINSDFYPVKQPGLDIHDLYFNIGTMLWHGENYPMHFKLNKNNYIVDNFNLVADKQSISLNGEFGGVGKEQLNFVIQNIDLTKILPIFNPGFSIAGLLNIDADLSGTLEEPRLQGKINLNKTKFNSFNIENLSAEFKYDNDLFQINSTLRRNEMEKIELICNVPARFPSRSNELLLKDQPFNINLYSENIDLAFLDLFSKNLTKTSGNLTFDIKVSDTINNPGFTGNVSVNKASVSIPQYGSNFDNISILLKLRDNTIEITNISAENENGVMNIKGSIDKAKNLFELQDLDLQFKANNFPLAKSRHLELILNSDITLTGNITNPAINGSVDILRSKIYLPAFQTTSKQETGIRPTLLTKIDSGKTIIKTPKNDSALLKNLRCKIKVNIPRNSWIRNEDMNLELSGNFDILKDSPGLKLFGTIQTVRGTINIYGKRFKISEGKIIFEGEEEITPNLNIEAIYDFRDVFAEKRKLKLKITGKTTRPAITFFLDNNPLDEKDAIAYLLFGRNSDELSFGEKSQLAQNEGLVSSARLEQVLTSRLTGELTNKLQNKLNLDVIEYKGNGNMRQATIILGKYITNDLFLSYKKEFHLGSSHEMAPEEIALEYEINKYLFLQATKGDDKTTGFDFFWKYEK